MEGMTEDRFIARRVIKLVYIGAATLLGGLLFGLVHRMALGEIVTTLFVDVLFAASFIFFWKAAGCMTKRSQIPRRIMTGSVCIIPGASSL